MWETFVFTFPIIKWFPELIANEKKWKLIKADVIAGITVGVMAIPQSMSYVNATFQDFPLTENISVIFQS